MNGGEPRLRGCIGTLEARRLISGFKDYALTRCYLTPCFFSCNSVLEILGSRPQMKHVMCILPLYHHDLFVICKLLQCP